MKTLAVVKGIGAYVPDDRLTNQELEKMVDTNDEWIRSRTGISERRILKKPETGTSYMAVRAVNDLLKKTNTDPEEIDFLICATVTPDMVFPATANIITDETGMKNAFGYDLQAACSGFVYALNTASLHIRSGFCKKVVVVGADKMSSIVDYTDRSTCILFGDAAGAVLLEASEDTEYGIKDAILGSDGSGRIYLHQKAGGSIKPASHETVDNREHYVYQEGKSVFKVAVSKMASVSRQLMERNNLDNNSVSWLVPHQANKRILDATASFLGLPPEKVMINIERFGNTTNATIPLCLYEWEKKLKKGDNLILATFGGGFTWGSLYIKWAYNTD
jgi:3-oxoacyl-[acyl-carrier-protein] synthase III